MSGDVLLEPHLWAALAFAVIAIGWVGYLYWRFYRGSE